MSAGSGSRAAAARGRGDLDDDRVGRARLRGDVVGESRHGRILEQPADREVNLEAGMDAADEPHGEQRLAAEVEEVIGHADALDPEHLAPDLGDRLLSRRAGSDVVAARRGGALGPGQRVAVQLSVRGERQRIERHQARGDHVGREGLGQRAPQRVEIDGRSGRDDVRGQRRLAGS